MAGSRSSWLIALLVAGCAKEGLPDNKAADLALAPDLSVVIISDPATWFGGGDPADYRFGPDYTTLWDGVATGHILALSGTPKSFATWLSSRAPGALAGNRVRYAAHVKARNVVGWAGLWMRVDDRSGKPTAFDNMMNRPITGTSDFQRHDIVLDVAADAATIVFGILLSGPGEVWVGRASLEVVGPGVPTTGG